MADARNVRFGFPWFLNPSNPSLANFTLQTSTDAIEVIFQVPPGAASYTLDTLGFRQTTVAGTAPTYQLSLQGVNASTGRADGSIKASGSAAVTFQPVAGGNATWQWKSLGASYSASPGEFLAMVINYSSGTINGSNNCSFAVSFNSTIWGMPCYWTVNTGVGTRSQAQPIYGWKAGGIAYGFPCQNVSNLSFNSTTTPDEYAVRWKIPTGFCSTYKVSGFDWYTGANVTTGKLPVATLYDTDGTTVLQNVTIDTDFFSGTRGGSFYFDEATLATLNAGSAYRLSIAPNDSSNQGVVAWDVAANADLADLPLGTECYSSSRTDAGSWSDANTRRLFLQPIFSDFTGGGSAAPPQYGIRSGGRL